MNKIYPRKKVRFPNGNWKYKYCGKSYKSIKEVKNDPNFKKFVRTWGDGKYELFCPSIGKVIYRLKICNCNFRATANKKGLPIRPSQYSKNGHLRRPECSDCYNTGYKLGFKKGEKIGSRNGYKIGLKEGYHQAEEEFLSYLDSISRIDQQYYQPAPRPIQLPSEQIPHAPAPEAPPPMGPIPIRYQDPDFNDLHSKRSKKRKRRD